MRNRFYFECTDIKKQEVLVALGLMERSKTPLGQPQHAIPESVNSWCQLFTWYTEFTAHWYFRDFRQVSENEINFYAPSVGMISVKCYDEL